MVVEWAVAHAGNTDIRAWVGTASKFGNASPAVRGTPKMEFFHPGHPSAGRCRGGVTKLDDGEREAMMDGKSGAVVLVDDQSAVNPWLDDARYETGNMNGENVLYNPFDLTPIEPGWPIGWPTANSNGYAAELIERMGLDDEFEKAQKKRGGIPWSPGWGCWPLYR